MLKSGSEKSQLNCWETSVERFTLSWRFLTTILNCMYTSPLFRPTNQTAQYFKCACTHDMYTYNALPSNIYITWSYKKTFTFQYLSLRKNSNGSFSRPFLLADRDYLCSPAVARQPIETVGQLKCDAGVHESSAVVFIHEHYDHPRFRCLQQLPQNLCEDFRSDLARNFQGFAYADTWSEIIYFWEIK